MNELRRSVISAFAFILVCESLVAAGLAHPDAVTRLPQPFRQLMRGIYLDGTRSIIQYEPGFARYDPDLSYTLKPGEFVFSNAEFSTPYRVNSLGVRSGESALSRPELIVLGDSRAMGWGVSESDMYSDILSRRTGLRTLNASVSSYGTAREMKLLDKLDVSGLKVLVLHYVENDDEENESFSAHGGSLAIMTKEVYEKTREKYLGSKRYFPGKYTALLLWRIGAEAVNGARRLTGSDRAPSRVENFLNALLNGRRTPLDGVRLVILGDGDFIERLGGLIAAGDYPAFVENAVLLSDDLPESGYFTLDNHLNPQGHRLLAERLLPAVR